MIHWGPGTNCPQGSITSHQRLIGIIWVRETLQGWCELRHAEWQGQAKKISTEMDISQGAKPTPRTWPCKYSERLQTSSITNKSNK